MARIEQKFTAKCGHTATSMMDSPTPHKMAVRRQYWRRTDCANCRHGVGITPGTIPTEVTAQCGHAVTAKLHDDPTLKSSPAQRRASAVQYWKTHDCIQCVAQTPVIPCTLETYRCGHKDWLATWLVTRIVNPEMERRYGPQEIQAARAAASIDCPACEDKDNPCLPAPTHRILTFTCGHQETWPEPVNTAYRRFQCATCLGHTEPPPIPPNAIVSSRRPVSVVREEAGAKLREYARRERAGLAPSPLPADWRESH